MTKLEILQQCTVEGMVVKLPNIQLERKLYQEVAKSLELIGGKWKGGKIMGFVFNQNPSELLSQIANGENRNLKKEFQFFETPNEIADYMVNLAQLKEIDRVLEPSAGQGAIIKAINRIFPSMYVECLELMELNRIILSKVPTAIIIGDDFLAEFEPAGRFDKIIANPPFSKNQDIAHVQKMFELLKPGGILVSITSDHWRTSNNKKETDFREWLWNEDKHVIMHNIPQGSFKSSGTMVGGNILEIHKT